MIIVSACLLGIKCRYDGKTSPDKKMLAMAHEGIFIPLCPEQLGGLPTPRPPAQIVGGQGIDVLDERAKVCDANNREVTHHFLKGAEEVIRIAKLMKVKKAIMKEMSPSCGVCSIYQHDVIVEGMGVTTALLMRTGIHVISSDNIKDQSANLLINGGANGPG
ncbi:MAG: DUF523 domain-containing protein [Syntrophales bacterium]